MEHEGVPIQNRSSHTAARSFIRYGCTTLLVLAGIFLLAKTTSEQQHNPSSPFLMMAEWNSKSDEKANDLVLEVVNKYSERDGSPGQQYSWLEGNLLVEPYQPTTFRVVNHDIAKEYQWEVYKKNTGDLENIFPGHEFVHSFAQEDVWSDKFVVVNEYEIDDAAEGNSRKISHSAIAKLYTRYVRREIRNLDEEDREEVLDAMAIHWKVSQEAGEKLYGPNYRSMLTLLEYHLSGAGDAECDHYHDGYGFLSQHAALTILFEQSLQAVNPRLALPYWDYVRDFEDLYQSGAPLSALKNKEGLFTADVFGATAPDGRVADGRWAGLTVPTVDDLGSDLARSVVPHDPYGHLRAPWANDPDRHVRRGAETCGVAGYDADSTAKCSTLAALTGLGTFEEWTAYASYAPHGPAHVLLGGALGCAAEWDAVAAAGVDEATTTVWRRWAQSYRKSGWRAGKIVCGEAGCACPELGAYRGDAGAARRFLEGDCGVTGLGGLTEDQVQAVVSAVCASPGLRVGENLQASSSWTPEFWPLHGTVERMLQLRLLQGQGGGGGGGGDRREEWWGGFDWSSTASWAGGSQADCAGHRGGDPVLLGRDRVRVKGAAAEVTAAGLLGMLGPDRMHELDYVYDTSDWAYCGIDILEL